MDLAPRTSQELVDIIAAAAADGVPLGLSGQGTKRDWGRSVSFARQVTLRGFSGIVDYAPAELVLTAGAGTPLAEIEQALAAEGQHLAFEPPDLGPLFGRGANQATIGGVLATNLSGSRRPFAGAARDFFLGFSGVNGRGEVVKAGGKVVKNVTGYDLPKLIAGSFGTLIALTEITIKVVPAPETKLLGGSGCGDPRYGQCLHDTGAWQHRGPLGGSLSAGPSAGVPAGRIGAVGGLSVAGSDRPVAAGYAGSGRSAIARAVARDPRSQAPQGSG
jgi:hypothetical protein